MGRRHTPGPGRRGGFTLVELLVVISVVALLIGLLIPALGAARAAGRSAVCLSNVRSMTLATLAYATDNAGSLVEVRRDVPGGRRWWFGLQVGTSSFGSNRPVDLTKSPLSPYAADFAAGISCPDFPFGDPGYNPKFSTPSAHFGLNGGLCLPYAGSRPRRLVEVVDASGTFAFADAVHQDFSATSFNEPHEVGFRCNGARSGAAHHRHPGTTANASFLDGHAAARTPLPGETVWATFAGGPVVNLDVAQGAGTLYGFDTWTKGICP